MEALRNQQLERVVDLTERMLRGARLDQWSDVAELEEQQRKLLRKCFESGGADLNAEAFGSAMRHIQALSDEIIGLAQRRKEALGSDMRVAKTGRMARSAYISCSR